MQICANVLLFVSVRVDRVQRADIRRTIDSYCPVYYLALLHTTIRSRDRSRSSVR
jgi:hypothetical protein